MKIDIKRRNEKILEFFRVHNFTQIRLIGKPHIPAIIFNNTSVLSCYVYNNELKFSDAPKDGNILYSVDLDNYSIDEEVLRDVLFLKSKHRKCFRIKLTPSDPLFDSLSRLYQSKDLFLTDYYFDDMTKKKYPIFLPSAEPKLYFEKKQAEDALLKITELHDLNLEII